MFSKTYSGVFCWVCGSWKLVACAYVVCKCKHCLIKEVGNWNNKRWSYEKDKYIDIGNPVGTTVFDANGWHLATKATHDVLRVIDKPHESLYMCALNFTRDE
jgi:hypothetical protein